MKHVSSRAANADNNRILTGRDINEIEFTPPIHANSVLGLTGRLSLLAMPTKLKPCFLPPLPGTVVAW